MEIKIKFEDTAMKELVKTHHLDRSSIIKRLSEMTVAQLEPEIDKLLSEAKDQ